MGSLIKMRKTGEMDFEGEKIHYFFFTLDWRCLGAILREKINSSGASKFTVGNHKDSVPVTVLNALNAL